MSSPQRKLSFSLLPDRYCICRLPPGDPLPVWGMKSSLASVTRTNEELSIICQEEHAPDAVVRSSGWRVLRLEGPFGPDEVGVLASLLTPLAEGTIPIMALSTHDTDYILVRAPELDRAVGILRDSGHTMVPGTSAG